jgi:hypothetical protein
VGEAKAEAAGKQSKGGVFVCVRTCTCTGKYTCEHVVCVCVSLCAVCVCVCTEEEKQKQWELPFRLLAFSPPPPCLTDAGVVEVWRAGVSGEEDD